MDVRFQVKGQWRADIIVNFMWEKEDLVFTCPSLEESAPWFSLSPALRDFKGKIDESVILYGPPKMDISRIFLLGLGTHEKANFTKLRFAIGKAVRASQKLGVKAIGFDMAAIARISPVYELSPEELARELALAAILSLYSFDRFLKKEEHDSNDKSNKIEQLIFMLDDEFCSDSLKKAIRMAEAEAKGIYLARDLANAPANHMTPTMMANEAEALAQRHNIQYRVLNREEMKNENMGSFLAVAQGAKEEPCFIILEYKGKNSGISTVASASASSDTDSAIKKPYILIGKGITFDSGGISLKPSAGMAEMKCDMSGAAAVLGTFEALGELAKTDEYLDRPIIGLIPCTENMPSGNAIRPGDIVKSKSGKTIEILNTDAEGRLILVDAITYATEHYDPEFIVDIATLTGACAVALGTAAGVFTDDELLADRLLKAGAKYSERNWRLPLWKDMLKDMKSPIADISNMGLREGGAIYAALFLQEFVPAGTRWAHIDMAAADNADNPLNKKGATGYGVRTLLDCLFMES